MVEAVRKEQSGDPLVTIANQSMSAVQIGAVALATALNALDGFDVLSISFAAPGISKSWGIDKAALGVVLSMELVGMAAGSILLGMVADRIGRRPTVLGCLLLMVVGMFLASTAPGLEALSAYRLLTGLGIGGMLATTSAIVAEFANARRRNLCVAVVTGGYPVGAVIGGTIASVLLARGGGWPTIFEFGAVMSALFIPLAWILLPETPAYLIGKRPKAALARVNALLLRMRLRPISELPPQELGSNQGRLGEILSGSLLAITSLLTAAYFLHMMTFYFLMKWIPKIITDYGFAPSNAGGVLVWANVGGASGALLLSVLTQRFPVSLLTIAAMIAGAVSIIWFGQNHGSLSSLSMAAALGGFFLNGGTACLYAMITQSFPARLRATGTGFIIGVGRGGAALGPIIAGILLDRGLPVPAVAATLACGTAGGALALLVLPYAAGGTAGFTRTGVNRSKRQR